jgi:hypothetical protein
MNAPNSFTGDTPVLMADGTRKPIKDVRVGDTVLATGESGPRKVTALINGDGDKQLVDITLDTNGIAGSATSTLTSTDGHPFWVPQLGSLPLTGIPSGFPPFTDGWKPAISRPGSGCRQALALGYRSLP